MRAQSLIRHPLARYLFAVVAVALAFGVRVLLVPVTGTGAPFVLFFASVTVTSLVAGVGPGIASVLISIPVAAHVFVVGAGYSVSQAAVQAILFAVDGLVVVYLTRAVVKSRRAVETTNVQLRAAGEETARAAERTREVIELAPDAFFLADLSGRFTDVNAAACQMLGYSREELVGKTISDIIPPEDAARLERTRGELMTRGAVQRGEWIQLRKDGSAVLVEISSNILPYGRWQAFARDITARKKLEDELREAEERFRLSLDEAPIGMAICALDGRFLRVNRALCEIVGYTPGELTGLTFQAITHPADLDTDLALAGRLARGELPRYELAKHYIRKDGSFVDVMLHASIVRSRDGAPLYYVAQIEDITERARGARRSAAGGHRPRLQRRHHHPGPERQDSRLEPRRRAHVRILRGRGVADEHYRHRARGKHRDAGLSRRHFAR